MVGLTFLVCSCGHNIARDFPGTKWAVTPVTSLLNLHRMFQVVGSSPKKLPFSHLLLGRRAACHTVFSDSDSEEDEDSRKVSHQKVGDDTLGANIDDPVAGANGNASIVVDLTSDMDEVDQGKSSGDLSDEEASTHLSGGQDLKPT